MPSTCSRNLFAGCALALGITLPVGSLPGDLLSNDTARLDDPARGMDDVPEKKDEAKKKKEVAVWVLVTKGPS